MYSYVYMIPMWRHIYTSTATHAILNAIIVLILGLWDA